MPQLTGNSLAMDMASHNMTLAVMQARDADIPWDDIKRVFRYAAERVCYHSFVKVEALPQDMSCFINIPFLQM